MHGIIQTISSRRVKITKAEPARMLIPGVPHLSSDSPLTFTRKRLCSMKNDQLNTERCYKRQGHAPLKHFVGFPAQMVESQNNGGIT